MIVNDCRQRHAPVLVDKGLAGPGSLLLVEELIAMSVLAGSMANSR